MAKVRGNLATGKLSVALNGTDVTSTMTSPELTRLPAVTGSDTAVIVLDPDRQFGEPEIVTVTAHTGGATTATITRQAEDAAAYPKRVHGIGTKWVNPTTKADWDSKSDTTHNHSGTYAIVGHTHVVAEVTNHNKAVHDALAIDAGTVDGIEGADIVKVSANSVTKDTIAASESTSNTSFVDLATVGPTVTLPATPRNNVPVNIAITASAKYTGGSGWAVMSYEVYNVTDSAVVQAPSDTEALVVQDAAGDIQVSYFTSVVLPTAGKVYRIRAKFRSSAGSSATFSRRQLVVTTVAW